MKIEYFCSRIEIQYRNNDKIGMIMETRKQIAAEKKRCISRNCSQAILHSLTKPKRVKGLSTLKTYVAIIIAAMGFSSCSMNGKAFVDDEKEYPEALFTLAEMATIELEIPEETWRKITTKASDKDYYECDVTINGERLDPIAIRTKGASSLDDVQMMKSDRYSFTLKLNKYKKGQEYHRLTKLLLKNNIWDATQMKDAIVYDMCRFIGLPAPLTNYARVCINGKLFGYYLMVEPVDKHFCRRNWPDEVTNIYKPYHNLAYTGEDMKQYAAISDYAKVKGGEASMKRVVEALRSVDEGKDIEEHIDVESVMKYMALQTMVVNFDCMTGHNTQNYYLREADGKISLIPWDYNLAWGGYPEDEEMEGEDMLEQSQTMMLPTDAGKRTTEEASRVVNFPIDTPFSADLRERTFFMKLLANEQFKARYYHYLDMLCNQYILGGEFTKTLNTINDEIGQFAGTEPNAFYTNEQFHKAQKTLQLVLEKRAASVHGQMKGEIPATWEGQKAQPQLLINSEDVNLQDLGGI